MNLNFIIFNILVILFFFIGIVYMLVRINVNILNQACDYVYITTPYLILDPELESALINAAK